MSLTERDRVQRGLDLVREGLAPFVRRELKARLGDGWEANVDERRREEGRQRLRRGSDGRASWDTSALLRVVLDWWEPVFADVLGQKRRLVDKVRHVRDSSAHEEPFSAEEADDALDSMRLLLEAAGAHPQARRIEEHLRRGARDRGGDAPNRAHRAPRSAPSGSRPPPVDRAPRQEESRRVPGAVVGGLVIAGLVGLSAMMFAVLPGPSEGTLDKLRGLGEFVGPAVSGAATPDDLSFLCQDSPTDAELEYAPLPAGEEDALRARAEELVLAVYGGPVTDPDAYEEAVGGMVVDDCFSRSPVGRDAEVVEGAARSGAGIGERSHAVALALFVVNKTDEVVHENGATYRKVAGEAVWVSETTDGELVGYQGTLYLTRNDDGSDDGGWRAAWGEEPSLTVDAGYERAVSQKIEELQYGSSSAAVPVAQEEVLAPAEAPRVEEAVRAFSGAYDYEGSSGDELLAQVEPYVTQGFWSSPRGAQNADSASLIDGPVTQETELLAWEPVEVGAEQAAGYATRAFRVEGGDGTEDYEIRHELRLVKEDGEWKVSWAGDPA